MRVSLAALADASSCGANPCTTWDYVWVSDECETYLSCAGLPAMTFSGQLGAGVQSIAGGAANIVGAAATGAASNVTTDIVLLIAGIALIAFLVKVP
jgi:hypothetical protein